MRLKDRRRKRFRPIKPNVSATAKYMKELRAVQKPITAFIRNKLLPLLEKLEPVYAPVGVVQDVDGGAQINTAFTAIRDTLRGQEEQLIKYSKGAATEAFTQGEKFQRKKWVAEINRIAGVDVSNALGDEGMRQELAKRVRANVDLIKTLQPEYLNEVENAVTEGLRRGDDFFSIRKRLLELESKHTQYRPKLIARDQMNKFTGALNQIRQEDLGIESYIWDSSGDERVREEHAKNDGKVFQWNNPPETGHPGEDVLCRCTATPVFESWVYRALGRTPPI